LNQDNFCFCHKIFVWLKWNVVFFRGGRSPPSDGSAGLAAGRGAGGAALRPPGRPAFGAFGINEGKAFQDDFEFALFLVGVFVFPSVQLQAAFDQERAALAHVLGDDLAWRPQASTSIKLTSSLDSPDSFSRCD
jgi:hypothetical protein